MIDETLRRPEDGPKEERQVVGLCLHYPEAFAVAAETVSRCDFSTPWLGSLFEACRFIPPTPLRPGPWPSCDPALWAETPVPDEWLAWLESVHNWRPRQAATLVMGNLTAAVALHDGCSTLDTLPRWVGDVARAAKLRRYRIACAHALALIDGEPDIEEVEAVLAAAIGT